MRWGSWAVVAGVSLTLATQTRSGISDPDTFWHIRAGEQLLATGNFTSAATGTPFSSNPWVLHEWVPEVALALAARAGLVGVVVGWQLALAVLVVALVATTSKRVTALPTMVAAAVAMYGASGGLAPRPQLVSFILVVVTLGAWLDTAEDGRPRWWLAPLSWVWACSHGFWFLGPGIGLVVILGLVIERRRTSPLRGKELVRLVSIPAAGLLLALVTPVGPRLLLVPLQISGYAQFVTEYLPSPLSYSPYSVTLVALVLVAVGWAVRAQPVRATRVLLWCLALFFTLLYARTVALGALVAAPLFAETLQLVVPPRVFSRRALVTAAAAGGLVSVAVVVAVGSGVAQRVPNGLDRQLAALPDGTVVYDDYAYGGWLLWAHPNLRPVIDGRTEIYTVAYVRTYVDSADAKPGWQATLTRSGARYALLPTDSPLGDGLVHQLRWTVVGTTPETRLLAAPTG